MFDLIYFIKSKVMKKYTLMSFISELHKIMAITQFSYEHITTDFYSFGIITREVPSSFYAMLEMCIIKDCTIVEHSYFNTHYYIINFNKDFSI